MSDKTLKTEAEINIIAEGGSLINSILRQTAVLAKPGISTWELSEFAEQEIAKIGGVPSFRGYGPKKNPFPSALCTSINNVVVHGIPSKEATLKGGDIISLDIGMVYKKLYTDTAITIAVGTITERAQKLIDVTKKSLELAIREVKPGNKIGDISFTIQDFIEKKGFSVVRDLVGHGVGYEVHEDPAVPCFGKKGQGLVLKEGLVIAIEPMVCEGEYFLVFERDGWTISTKDGGLAAHFEHTVAVTKHGCRVLT